MSETVINATYTPPEHRSNAVGNIKDDRPLNVRIADANFQPVMPEEPDHEFDSRIEQLEKQALAKKRDEEFAKARTPEARELLTLKYRREADLDLADKRQAEKQWLESQSEPLNRLAELREVMSESDAGMFTIADVVAVDKARRQFTTLGSDVKAGQKMLDQIEERYSAAIEQQTFETQAQIASLQNKIQKLKARPLESDEPDEFDKKMSAAKSYMARMNAAREANDLALMQKIMDEQNEQLR